MATAYALVVILCVSVLGVAYVASSRTLKTYPGGSSAGLGTSGPINIQTQTPSYISPEVPGASPLPSALIGPVPLVTISYDNEPFSGVQGSYCWVGTAETTQNASGSPTCQDVAMPNALASLPTVAVYPNATLFFQYQGQPPDGISASLYESGSMQLVLSNSSAVSGFPLGSLSAGDYLLSVNASYDHSFVSEYLGIKEIGAVNFSEGAIHITVGNPDVQMESFSWNTTGGASETVGFPGLEAWPLTLTSANAVSNVNLSAISVINGNWVRFLPSIVPEVGPNGTEVQMLLAGSVRPFVNNDISNVSMIIQASGSGGVSGEVALPLEGSSGPIVVHSLAGPSLQAVGSTWSVSANQSNFGIYSIVYDPSSDTSSQPVPVTVSIAGFLEATGQISPQPTWLQFFVPQSSESMNATPFDPLYFEIGFSSTSAAPNGSFTLVIDINIGGQQLMVYSPVTVSAPIIMSAGT